MRNKLFSIFAGLALVALSASSALAATAPGNDVYGGRVVIGALPFSASVDTTGATTDAADAEANASLSAGGTPCGAPATDASVWYQFVATADGDIVVDVSTSDYSAGVIVVSGNPGNFTLENCGLGTVAFSGSAGVTYTILAFDDPYDGSGNGGTLRITVGPPPAPPEVHLTVNSTGNFNSRTGSATIRGTITCTGGDEFGKNNIGVQLTQTVGRLKITAEGEGQFVCDGTTQPWAVDVLSSNGKFGGGKAAVFAYANACAGSGCGFDSADRVVTLRK
jgi:hypothetical protein